MPVEIGRGVLKSALARTTSAAEGAKLVGSGLTGVTGSTVQAMLEGLKTLIDGKANSDHAHAGAAITSGTVDVARIGTGTKDTTTFYRGDGTFAALPSGGITQATETALGGAELADAAESDAGTEHTRMMTPLRVAQRIAAIPANAVASIASLRKLGTTASDACAGNDGRLSDARTPTTHSHAHTDLTSVDTDSATTAIHHTLGAGANQAAAGNDTRFHNHGDSVIKTIRVTTTETNANATANTLQDIPALAFPIVAGQQTWFRIVIEYTTAASTTGARFTLNGPTLTRLSAFLTQSVTPTTQRFETQTAYNSGVPTTDSTGTVNLAVLEGVIVCSASGTVTPRFSSEVASSGVSVRIGSITQWNGTG